jgi:peroxiredoxin
VAGWKGGALTTVVAVATAAVVVLAALYPRAPRATRVHVGEVAPDFTLPSVPEGRPTRLAALRGGPTVLVFFDTRWEGSDAYFRYIERLHRRYFRRGLRTVAVALDSDPAPIAAFIRRNELTFAILSDPDGRAIEKGYGTPRDPESYLLDTQGRVEAVWVQRINWGDPASKELLERHLEPARPGMF